MSLGRMQKFENVTKGSGGMILPEVQHSATMNTVHSSGPPANYHSSIHNSN